jgi:hypothetical protein
VEEYLRLWSAAGRPARSEETVRAALAGTYCGATLRLGGEAIGMGRVVGDGACSFAVVDVVLAPGHADPGLGAQIAAALVASVRERAPAGAQIVVVDAATGPAPRSTG